VRNAIPFQEAQCIGPLVKFATFWDCWSISLEIVGTTSIKDISYTVQHCVWIKRIETPESFQPWGAHLYVSVWSLLIHEVVRHWSNNSSGRFLDLNKLRDSLEIIFWWIRFDCIIDWLASAGNALEKLNLHEVPSARAWNKTFILACNWFVLNIIATRLISSCITRPQTWHCLMFCGFAHPAHFICNVPSLNFFGNVIVNFIV